MKKAKICLLLRPKLTGTFISIDGKAMPYRSIEIKQDYEKTTLRLTRCIGDDGCCTEDLVANPIIEEVEADPLIVITSSDPFNPLQDFNVLNSQYCRDHSRMDLVISPIGDLK